MKVGDWVARIVNEWQNHNKWMEFPDEKPEPLGIIVSQGMLSDSWNVLKSDGTIVDTMEHQMIKIEL